MMKASIFPKTKSARVRASGSDLSANANNDNANHMPKGIKNNFKKNFDFRIVLILLNLLSVTSPLKKQEILSINNYAIFFIFFLCFETL